MRGDERLVKAAENLLMKEREALLSGDFDRLSDLLDGKQSLFDSICNTIDDPAVIGRIVQSAKRNQTLFSAAIAGVKDASAQIEALCFSRENLQVYGREGRRDVVDVRQPKIERKF